KTAELEYPSANTPFFPIEPAAPQVHHLTRFRALALFGRRPHQRVDSHVMMRSSTLVALPVAELLLATLYGPCAGAAQAYRRRDHEMGQGDLGSQHQAVVRPMRRIFHKSR